MQPGQIIKNLTPSEPVTLNHVQPLVTIISLKFTGVNSKRANTKAVSAFEKLEALTDEHVSHNLCLETLIRKP